MHKGVAAGLAALGMAGAAQGASAAETFDVGADATSCTVYRQATAADTPMVVGVRHFPGQPGVTALLSVPPAMAIERRAMRPAFDNGDLSIGAIEVARTSAGTGVYLLPIEPAPGTVLPPSGTATLRGFADAPVVVDMGQIARMVRAAGECERGLLASWNVEPDGPMSVTLAATPRSATWINVEDVPDRYLDKINGRFTTILWTIGDDAKITDCRVLVPSGDEALDKLACPTLRRKVSYKAPARNGTGQPVSSLMVRRIRWGPIE
ncbi:hypothetical protein [Sphingomonas sp. Y38-1Y]|uniref:hypothetical protein n=1 Tax=Sphingomonas sp. Y38-1Y TaxID=3078265 RepID=UPI0028E9E8A9|nr:hypothetical protein [Sphingomonas sp. Y38-1Y]